MTTSTVSCIVRCLFKSLSHAVNEISHALSVIIEPSTDRNPHISISCVLPGGASRRCASLLAQARICLLRNVVVALRVAGKSSELCAGCEPSAYAHVCCALQLLSCLPFNVCDLECDLKLFNQMNITCLMFTAGVFHPGCV